MIEEMLRNGFGVIAYMDDGELVVGFLQTEGIKTAHCAKEPNSEDLLHASVTTSLHPKVPVDAEALLVALGFVSKVACNLFFGEPESEND